MAASSSTLVYKVMLVAIHALDGEEVPMVGERVFAGHFLSHPVKLPGIPLHIEKL